MLSNISWPQYFAAIAVTGTCYYSYTILRYYQREISGFLTRRAAGSTVPAHRLTAPVSVIGTTKEDPHISYLDEKEVLFAGDDEETAADTGTHHPAAANAGPESLQQQMVRETDQLMEAFAAEDNKGEFLSLLAILLAAYRQHASELDFPALATYIFQVAPSRLPFSLSAGDLSEILN